jgi:hypothetical protein
MNKSGAYGVWSSFYLIMEKNGAKRIPQIRKNMLFSIGLMSFQHTWPFGRGMLESLKEIAVPWKHRD